MPMPAPRVMFIEDEDPLMPALQDDLEERGISTAWIAHKEDEEVGLAFSPDVVVLGDYTTHDNYSALFDKFAIRPAATSLILARSGNSEELRDICDQARDHYIPVLGTMARPFALPKLTGMIDGSRFHGSGSGAGDYALVSALVRNRRLIPNLAVEFQSKHDLHTGMVAGYEALTRLKIRRALDPAIIYSQLVGLDVEREATLFVIDEAAELANRFERSAHPLPIAFNCSAAVLASEGFVDGIKLATRRHRVAPRWLTVEVTEDARPTNQRALLHALEQLHATGMQIAIDDFGTGMANLDRLAEWPFDEVKIDKSIFWACASGRLPMSFVSGILDLCKAREKRSVIEGVESDIHLAKAKMLGADLGQGYYWGKAVPPNIFAPAA